MSYEIRPTKGFEKEFYKLDRYIQQQIVGKFEEVAVNPERYKHLKFDLCDSCRIRIGKLRIIFSYDINKKELYLEKIVFRHDY